MAFTQKFNDYTVAYETRFCLISNLALKWMIYYNTLTLGRYKKNPQTVLQATPYIFFLSAYAPLVNSCAILFQSLQDCFKQYVCETQDSDRMLC